MPGLTVRVSPSGVKVFYLYRRIGGKPERIKIGRFPQVTLEVARLRAAELNGQIAMGHNPALIKRSAKGEITLGKLFEDYMSHHVSSKGKHLSTQTARSYRYAFDQYCTGMKNDRASTVTSQRLRAIHRNLTPARGNFFKVMMMSLFTHGIKHEFLLDNPAKKLPTQHVSSRERFIQPDEMQRFLDAVQRSEYRDYWLMLLLTGARSGNVMAMRWDQIDFEAGVWRIPDSKTGVPLQVVLAPQVIDLLNGRRHVSTDWVFPGKKPNTPMTTPKRPWENLLSDAGLSDLRVHDLRRTLGSWQARRGSSLPIIGKSLGHASQAATAIYARLDDDPVRASVVGAVDDIITLYHQPEI